MPTTLENNIGKFRNKIFGRFVRNFEEFRRVLRTRHNLCSVSCSELVLPPTESEYNSNQMNII